jgi:uncharacterized lipoprotein YmbA
MRYVIFLFLIIFAGCSSKNSGYILPSTSSVNVARITTQIGVEKVELPEYLNSGKILLKSGLKVSEIDSNFIAPPSELLTSKTINILKSSLNNPNVLLYPWDIKSQKGYIVKIKLDKFLYDSSSVVVAGSYYIKSANKELISSKNFTKIATCSKDVKSIVTTLSELFDTVVVEIAQKIAR